MAGLLPSFSNVVHKLAVELAVWNALKGGLKESNRRRIPMTITANASAVVEYIAPWDGSVEGLIIASPDGATTSSSGNTVTTTVVNKNGGATLFTADTYVSLTELAVNTGVAFFNAGPAISGGGRVSQFKAGDVLTVTGAVSGSPGITSSGHLNIVLTLTPTDPKAAF